MAKSTVQNVVQTTSNIGPSQLPYYNTAMQQAAGLLTAPVPIYDRDRLEGFTAQQKNLQGQVAGLQAPSQFGAATNLANTAGLGSIAAGQYTPGQFNSGYNPSQFNTGFSPSQFTVGGLGNLGNVRDVAAERAQADKMNAAQTQFQANLERFQMAAPDQFGQRQINQYMSPYMQNVVDTQKREAIRDARQGQIVQDLGAARQGTYGGSRQLLAGLERERGLGQQLGDIQARGLQSGYEQAAQQFERDRAAGMTAQQENLRAALGVQELGTKTGLEVALANLSNEQQARVQNMAAENQMRGMNAENALRAALANQQADLGVRGQNLQGAMQTQQLGLDAQRMAEQSRQFGSQQGLEAQRLGDASRQFGSSQGLEAQRLGEQSRQFGSQQGLAGLAQANQAGQTLANIGSAQQQADAQRLGLQMSTAAQEQAFKQQERDLDYADFMREADNPYTQLQRYMGILSGVPQATTSTSTTSGPAPSLGAQIMGAGLGALGTYNTLRG